MRHSVHIMFGPDFVQTQKEVQKYVVKYGEKSVSPYFNAIHWDKDIHGNVSLSKLRLNTNHQDEFISGLNDLYQVDVERETFEAVDVEISVKEYFDQLFATTVTIENPGEYNELHISLYIPLYDEYLWEQAKQLTNWLKSLSRQLHIDLIGFSADLDHVINGGNKALNAKKRNVRELDENRLIEEITKYRELNPDQIYHFLIIQNAQSGGVSLNLNADSFIRILGELAILCVENYHSLFGNTPPESDLQSIGLSVLHFDKYYFIDYLLKKAYLFSMEKEGVHEQEVDINLAFNKSKEILEGRISLLSEFLKKEVFPKLEEKNNNEAKIVEEIVPLLNDKLKEIESECLAVINDREFSIPAKRAILAALIGHDDESFVNNVFEDNLLFFDDLNTEAMNVFIEANNSLLSTDSPENALLSDNEEPVIYPLHGIKALRVEMQRRIGYLKKLEEEKSNLENQIGNIDESKKCLIEDGYFVYGDNKYRMLPDIVEEPLKDDYVARKVNIPSIDLRKNFNRIKNQGQQGACLSFTLTSIYEYILNGNNVDEIDLSEAFLYYNSRKREGKEQEDKGSKLIFAADSLVEDGICIEKLFEYNDTVYNKKPEDQAYLDAKQRRVKKVLNVKGEINDIKSALSDGYPVAISVKLFPSFGKNQLGFVSLPSEEEISNWANEEQKHGNHAMVIAGFNDEKKFFVVRNSWGEDFGDNGYCFLPYAYISNDNFFNWACVIAEVETYSAVNSKPKTKLKFDETNANIRFSIVNNLFIEELQRIKENEQIYLELKRSFENLKSTVEDPNIQARLRQFTESRISKGIKKLEQEREIIKKEKYEELDTFDKITRKTGFKLVLAVCVLFVIGFLLFYYVLNKQFSWAYTWYSFGVFSLLLGSLFLYFPFRKMKRQKLEQEQNDLLESLYEDKWQKEQELAQNSLKMHIAGSFLSNLFQIQASVIAMHSATSSLLSNLKTWYSEELRAIKKSNANTQIPFISLIKNEVLDRYFVNNKNRITANIFLCEELEKYSRSIKNKIINIEDLKCAKENIKNNCVKELEDLMSDFNMYSYLCDNKKEYEYLDRDSKFLKKIIPDLDDKSQIFLNDKGTGIINPNKLILINTKNNEDAMKWSDFYPGYFTEHPSANYHLSPFKLMVVQLANLKLNQVVNQS